MKFLIDENIPQFFIKYLKQQGHYILDLKTSKWSQSIDNEVKLLAIEKKLIIITFDKDFLRLNRNDNNLCCIFLQLNTIDSLKLEQYFNYLLTKYKYILKRKRFLLICKKDEISII
jgi:predicted nuclease of predicted toxin-antitoxin system